uniref:Uncharacterized protein n=1 Tax=Romanomermis culicivorax TaxID=13658 RepID=A0A915IZI6_ROMCU
MAQVSGSRIRLGRPSAKLQKKASNYLGTRPETCFLVALNVTRPVRIEKTNQMTKNRIHACLAQMTTGIIHMHNKVAI